MKKIIYVLTLCVAFLTTAPSFAAPPPMYRPMPIYRPYYYSYYYPSYYRTTYYSYYPTRYYSDIVTPVSTSTNAVIVRDDYAGINTAANVINAAANVASTIRYLTW